MFLADDFRPFLRGHDLNELETMDSTALGLRSNLTIGYRNAAWDRFAIRHGGPTLAGWNGRSILDVLAEPLRPFYADLFKRVQRTRKPREHTFEWSSPEVFRQYRMRALPLQKNALLVVHHLVDEHPHDREALAPHPHRYIQDNGFIVQCCHCMMVRRADDTHTWDWVPAYISDPPDAVSHGLCPLCFRHHYPQLAARWDVQHGKPTPM